MEDRVASLEGKLAQKQKIIDMLVTMHQELGKSIHAAHGEDLMGHTFEESLPEKKRKKEKSGEAKE